MEERFRRSIGFVGAGRLAASLAAGLAQAGYDVTVIASAHHQSAQALAAAIGPAVVATADMSQVAALADVVFLTVPDSAILKTCASVPWAPKHVVAHCSGALGLDVLATATQRGASVGCLHPLQTFPSRTPEPARFEGIHCGVEGAGSAGSRLEQFVNDLGAKPFRLEGVDRATYHAAAVMVSNFVVALASAGGRLWELAGLDPLEGREALAPLMLAAAENVSKMELAKALTGPVARGDIATVERHLAALDSDAGLLELYRLLSAELLRLPLGHDAATVARMRERLNG